MTFIQEILQSIINESDVQSLKSTADIRPETLDSIDWRSLTLLFPSKRPAAYLKQELSKQISGPIPSPQCLAIADFITEYSKLTPVDTMTLVFELYEIYLSLLDSEKKPLDLLTFYPLGETLIADYGDIDKDLVDAKSLFANYKALSDLQNEFSLEQEQMETFNNFWSHFSTQEPKKMQQEFLELWELMGQLYFEFRTTLQQKGIAYSGLAERNMVDHFGDLSERFKGKTICICGFNALTKAEIKLFKELETVADVKYFFDYDEHYMAKHHEAGHFMRRNFHEFKGESSRFKGKNNLKLETRNLKLTSASGTTGMVQALYHDVLALDPSKFNEKTGIVLPDENALRACIEVLPSLPTTLNITMGMPLQSAGIWSLVKSLFELQLNYNEARKGFLYRDVIAILQHPELLAFQNYESHKLQNAIAKQNIIYCGEKWLREQEIHASFKSIFSKKSSAQIIGFIQGVLAELEKQTPDHDVVKHSILINAYKQGTRFSDLYAAHLANEEPRVVWSIFKKATKAVNIAFEGEPIKGVQLMGLLESRAIDFETLFVLSVNEGIMPKSSRHQSLIPFGIRKAFGMNTFREDDAVSAYYFYRMLQRAKDIHLYYNTDTDGDSKGEMSRYILQIQQELPNFKITEHNFSIRSKAIAQEHLSIKKTEAVLEGLEQYQVINGVTQRPLSPSALSTYIKSPMQFYLRYVANFRERDEVLEEMDPITLGNIVHNTLEELYTPHLQQEITHELVDNLKGPKLRKSLEKFLEKEMNLKPEHLQGRNLLFYNICEKLCLNVLDNDAKTPGLRIQALEFDELFYDIKIETQQGPKVIRLKGQFDRLDEVDEQIRVVDYKTGKVEIPKDAKKLITEPFKEGRFAAALQTLFYTLVYLKNYPNQSVIPVIYHLKSSENMIKPVSENPIDLNQLTEYEFLLKQKLEELWNSDIPFAFDDYEEESKYLMMEVL